jgi:hypothetical protein
MVSQVSSFLDPYLENISLDNSIRRGLVVRGEQMLLLNEGVRCNFNHGMVYPYTVMGKYLCFFPDNELFNISLRGAYAR